MGRRDPKSLVREIGEGAQWAQGTDRGESENCSKDSECFFKPLAIPGKLEGQESVLDALPPVQSVEGPPHLPHRLLHHLLCPQLVQFFCTYQAAFQGVSIGVLW